MPVKKINRLLTSTERKVFGKLRSPTLIQDFLESIPINYELHGETNYSPRMVLKKRIAHCFEGAIFAAAVLCFHGHRPLIMDFATAYDDEDHCVALFKEKELWGAISKTNHAVLRYRDPIYRTPRELAMSYAHEYFLWDGRKSLRAYSRPFDLSRFEPSQWITSDDVDWLHEKIAAGRYENIAPESALKKLRRASKVELKALAITERPDPRKRKS